MLYKLNSKATKKLYNVIFKDPTIKDKLQGMVDLQCHLNNVLLHSAMTMTRSEYIKYFNDVYIGQVSNKYKTNLNFSDFGFSQEGVLNNHGKKKLLDTYENKSIKKNYEQYIIDFTGKCFLIEQQFKKENEKDFEMFNISFSKEDFY